MIITILGWFTAIFYLVGSFLLLIVHICDTIKTGIEKDTLFGFIAVILWPVVPLSEAIVFIKECFKELKN